MNGSRYSVKAFLRLASLTALCLIIACASRHYNPIPIPLKEPTLTSFYDQLARSVVNTHFYAICDLAEGEWPIDKDIVLVVPPKAQLVMDIRIHEKRLKDASLRTTQPIIINYNNDIHLQLSRVRIQENGHPKFEDLRVKEQVVNLLYAPIVRLLIRRLEDQLAFETSAYYLLKGQIFRRGQTVNIAQAQSLSKSNQMISPDLRPETIETPALPTVDLKTLITRLVFQTDSMEIEPGSVLSLGDSGHAPRQLTLAEGTRLVIRRGIMKHENPDPSKPRDDDPLFSFIELWADAHVNLQDATFGADNNIFHAAGGSSISVKGLHIVQKGTGVPMTELSGESAGAMLTGGVVKVGSTSLSLATSAITFRDFTLGPQTAFQVAFDLTTSHGSLSVGFANLDLTSNGHLVGQASLGTNSSNAAEFSGRIHLGHLPLRGGTLHLTARESLQFTKDSALAIENLDFVSSNVNDTVTTNFSSIELRRIWGAIPFGFINGITNRLVVGDQSNLKLTSGVYVDQKLKANMGVDLHVLSGKLPAGSSDIYIGNGRIIAADLILDSTNNVPISGMIDYIGAPADHSRLAIDEKSYLLLDSGNIELTNVKLTSIGDLTANLAADVRFADGHFEISKDSWFDLSPGGRLIASSLQVSSKGPYPISGEVDLLNFTTVAGQLAISQGSWVSIKSAVLTFSHMTLPNANAQLHGFVKFAAEFDEGRFKPSPTSAITIFDGSISSKRMELDPSSDPYLVGTIEKVQFKIKEGSLVDFPGSLHLVTNGIGSFESLTKLKMNKNVQIPVGVMKLSLDVKSLSPAQDSEIQFQGGSISLPFEGLETGSFSSPVTRNPDGTVATDLSGDPIFDTNQLVSYKGAKLFVQSSDNTRLAAIIDLEDGKIFPGSNQRLEIWWGGRLTQLEASYTFDKEYYGVQHTDIGDFITFQYSVPATLTLNGDVQSVIERGLLTFGAGGVHGGGRISARLNMNIPQGVGEYLVDNDPSAGGKHEGDWANWQEAFRLRWAIVLGSKEYIHFYLRPRSYPFETKLEYTIGAPDAPGFGATLTEIYPVDPNDLKEDNCWKKDGGPNDILLHLVAFGLGFIPIIGPPAELAAHIAIVLKDNWIEGYIDTWILKGVSKLNGMKTPKK
jgi:hypothetical protein